MKNTDIKEINKIQIESKEGNKLFFFNYLFIKRKIDTRRWKRNTNMTCMQERRNGAGERPLTRLSEFKVIKYFFFEN